MPNDYIDCEVHNDCLDCPLSICKFDDLLWFQRSLRMGRWYAMDEMHLGGASAEDTAAVFGVTVRTVYRSIVKVNNGSMSPGDRAVFARLAPNLPEALRTEPPFPRPRPCRDCGEDISERNYRARLCYRCGAARSREKTRKKQASVRAETPVQYLPAADPYLPAADPVITLPLRFLPRFDLFFNVEMGLE